MSIVSASSDKAEGSQAGGRATPLVVLGNRRQSSTYKTQGEPWRRASLAAINTASQTVLAGRHMWGGRPERSCVGGAWTGSGASGGSRWQLGPGSHSRAGQVETRTTADHIRRNECPVNTSPCEVRRVLASALPNHCVTGYHHGRFPSPPAASLWRMSCAS